MARYTALKDLYLKSDKRPSIKKGQRWLVEGLRFSKKAEDAGFISTWICRRLGTEVFLHKEEALSTFGKDVLMETDMYVDVR